MNKHNLKIIAIIIVFMALGAGVGIYTARHQQIATTVNIDGLLWPDPKQLHAFNTIDDKGGLFGLQQMQGKWSFVFFGFTNCPDICPITLSVLNKVKADIREHSSDNDIQVVFVSIDPERDTQQQLSDYVGYFNKEFIGLGGSQEQIQSLTNQIGVMYFRGKTSESGDYLMDHSASVFLIDPKGRMVGIFSAPHTPDDIAARFTQIKAFIEGQI